MTALVLASEYDRAKTLSGDYTDWLRAIDIDRWDPYVSQTLHDVGFLALLGVEKTANLVERNGIITLPFLSGTKVHGEIIDELIRAMAVTADSTGSEDSDTLLSRSRLSAEDQSLLYRRCTLPEMQGSGSPYRSSC